MKSRRWNQIYVQQIIGLLLSQKIDHGSDPTSLSRWTWARFHGKGNTAICTMRAYRPTINHGPTTTWSQHCRYYQEHRKIQNPDVQAIFDKYLVTHVKAWSDLGDSIILGIDANDDVRHSRLTQSLSSLGIRDGILSTHPASSPHQQPLCSVLSCIVRCLHLRQ